MPCMAPQLDNVIVNTKIRIMIAEITNEQLEKYGGNQLAMAFDTAD